MNIQLDFGGFDPAFLGVSIKLSSDRLFQFHKAYISSPTPLPVGNLARDERFEALSIASVFPHEVRHFHDFFLTPYSARVFSIRVEMLVNLLQAIPRVIKKDGPNCIPVPFVTWCNLGPGQRKKQLEWLPSRSDGKAWVPVSLPRLDSSRPLVKGDVEAGVGAASLEHLLAAAFYLRNGIREFAHNPHTVRGQTSFQPWQVFELSALLVQISEIWLTYGRDETEFFMNYLLDHSNSPYATLLKITNALWDEVDEPIDLNMASAIAIWSLMGSYKLENWKACPTARFARLMIHLRQTGIPSWNDDVFELFDDWSRRLELSTVREGLLDAGRTFRSIGSLIDSKGDLLSKTAIGAHYTSLLQRITAGAAKASEHMTTAFTRDAKQYVALERYSKYVDQLVNPVVRMVFPGGGIVHDLSEEQSQQRGYRVQWALQKEGQLVAQSVVEPHKFSEHEFVDPKDVIELCALNGLADFLVSDTDRTHDDVQRAGMEFFRNTNLRPFELLM